MCQGKYISNSRAESLQVLSDLYSQANWFYWGWLLIKPFHGRNFHTAVNSVRWLKATQFAVRSLHYSSLLIFSQALEVRSCAQRVLLIEMSVSLHRSALRSTSIRQTWGWEKKMQYEQRVCHFPAWTAIFGVTLDQFVLFTFNFVGINPFRLDTADTSKWIWKVAYVESRDSALLLWCDCVAGKIPPLFQHWGLAWQHEKHLFLSTKYKSF